MHKEKAFTLIELLVVIAIISAMMGILLPALSKVKYQARSLISVSNQHGIVSGVSLYATDNDERYPDSVATIGSAHWNWAEPMMLTGYNARGPGMHRSMSAYLRPYIKDAETLYSPTAPRKYKFLQAAWDAGDEWDNPETPTVGDTVSGTYCFYWNYTGYLEERDYLFQGPRNSASGGRCSKLLVSDYFGYNHWRSPGAYSSCEKFAASSITEGTAVSSDYWSGEAVDEPNAPQIKLRAGYTDGHVETYSSSDTLTMRVIIDPGTGEPYPEDIEPGRFFLPTKALH
jgi:prepilin-type N-terminal cleavage/methylation domain-containing protein